MMGILSCCFAINGDVHLTICIYIYIYIYMYTPAQRNSAGYPIFQVGHDWGKQNELTNCFGDFF